MPSAVMLCPWTRFIVNRDPAWHASQQFIDAGVAIIAGVRKRYTPRDAFELAFTPQVRFEFSEDAQHDEKRVEGWSVSDA